MEKIFCQDIEDSEFARLDDSEKDSEFVAVESKTYFQDDWGRFKKNKLALVSRVYMAVVILLAVFAPMSSPYTYDGQDLTCRNAHPNAAHWFGTDKFGRDIFVRIMYGARISLSVGFAAALLNLVIGVAYGAICGYFGGKVDMILLRLVDIIYSVPTLFYVIYIMLIFGSNIFSMLLAIFSVILMLDYPLEPSQVSLISMFTIGIPSFVLALEPNKELIRGHFLTNVLVRALPAGLTDFIVVSGLVIFCREFQVDLDCLSTSCTILVAIVGFMILHRIARPMNTGHIVMLVGVIAGWILCMLFGGSFFGITGISKQCEMLMVIFAIITEPVLRYLSLIVEWISARCRMIHARFSRA